jgi:hypothetical protein
MDQSFTIAAGPRQRSHSQVRVPPGWGSLESEAVRVKYGHVLPHIRDSPNLEGQVPVFISPKNRVAQLYPQTLGSLFVASYHA